MRTSAVAIFCLTVGITLSFALPSGNDLPPDIRRKLDDEIYAPLSVANHNIFVAAHTHGPHSIEFSKARMDHFIASRPLEMLLKEINQQTPTKKGDAKDMSREDTDCVSHYFVWHTTIPVPSGKLAKTCLVWIAMP
ncbi:hypothetical protein F5148DRAFT_1166384 [Russula earlei]|uniref:Uncharacterized protein n=1 Tax=Russula earlei TaxID=71964 RepID=A0ACC0UJW8_9AGAM|nr:hypothetical protein F5148DRAFT_1166384 [Russula earlei]